MYDEILTLGERLADMLADFTGSWLFIGLLLLGLIAWTAINAALLMIRPIDPYPFILHNLILSCIAAIRVPAIMVSQKREEVRDRLPAEQDYQVNLKAEREIDLLHEKNDRLLHEQGEGGCSGSRRSRWT
ncbi:MAG: DUF1003 domain-containing protein [Methanomicrobiales archaeon]|nr:DUF1003 domain-containing protein [Methanomicrobiales archaeon]